MLFCVDTCTAFGATPSAGAYGHVADGGTKIFRAQGLSPLDKWVDDHIFIHIQHEHLPKYNELQKEWHKLFASEGLKQTGSRLWFGDLSPDNSQLEELSEDCSHPLKDLLNDSPRSLHDLEFMMNMQDIDKLSSKLGILWALSKDQPFRPSTVYIGFLWDLNLMVVSLSTEKTGKYLMAIHKWHKRRAHILQDVQELYGKLLHTCSVVP
ncbi:hypothetical protein AZE42_13252 [Rhizopogon vesiculosus]|uniref:Uncharacterized protein n=1 Tax=Rhizopogon vesiculosus TaxID=180088 RepID=A0A1J8QH62_9AGAM|nr:hypothetical protein AZE42_13252 [Rhizopogon vesiculosus]